MRQEKETKKGKEEKGKYYDSTKGKAERSMGKKTNEKRGVYNSCDLLAGVNVCGKRKVTGNTVRNASFLYLLFVFPFCWEGENQLTSIHVLHRPGSHGWEPVLSVGCLPLKQLLCFLKSCTIHFK